MNVTIETVLLALLLVWTVVGVFVLWRVTNSKGKLEWASQTTAPEPDSQAITFTTEEIQTAIRAQVAERIKNGEKL